MTGTTAIIPNWNRREPLVQLIQQLRAQTTPFTEVVVVDNGSEDGSADAAEQCGARVLRLGRNLGFAAAANRGVAAAATGYLAVLNNDVELEPDWLERLTAALDQSGENWFATGRIFSSAHRDLIDGTFDLISRGACAWRAGHGRPDGPAWHTRRRIWFAPFTAALFRASLFECLGPLDERFESYLEDVDFGLRCACARRPGIYVPEARAYHQGSATLGRWHEETVRRISRNQLLLVAKHYPAGWLRRFGWPVLAGQALWCALAFGHGAGMACLRGKLEGWRGFRDFRRANASLRSEAQRPIAEVLEESERELRAFVQTGVMDTYWRFYFGLT